MGTLLILPETDTTAEQAIGTSYKMLCSVIGSRVHVNGKTIHDTCRLLSPNVFWVNLVSVGPILILAPYGAKPSAGIVLTATLYKLFYQILHLSIVSYNLFLKMVVKILLTFEGWWTDFGSKQSSRKVDVEDTSTWIKDNYGIYAWYVCMNGCMSGTHRHSHTLVERQIHIDSCADWYQDLQLYLHAIAPTAHKIWF